MIPLFVDHKSKNKLSGVGGEIRFLLLAFPLGEGAAHILRRMRVTLPVFDLECYTISAVDKSPKIWYNKEQGTRKEGKEDGTI